MRTIRAPLTRDQWSISENEHVAVARGQPLHLSEHGASVAMR